MLTYCNGVWHIGYKFADDLGFRRARDVFEALEARNSVLFHWDDHYTRLLNSLKAYKTISLDRLPSRDEIEKTVKNLLEKSGARESVVHIIVTPGRSKDMKSHLDLPTLSVDVLPFPFSQNKPFKLKTVHTKRDLPEFKLIAGYGYVDFYEEKAKEEGFDKILYWDEREGILEGAYENVFFVTKSGLLLTPRDNILKGVTRKIVLELARSPGLFKDIVERQSIHIRELKDCTEVFLTSTTLGVAEVARIDDYSHFKTGSRTLTSKLKKLFLEYREKYYKERGA